MNKTTWPPGNEWVTLNTSPWLLSL